MKEKMSRVHEMQFLREKIDELKEQGVYRKLPELQGPSGALSVINGREVINLSSNNYLGFANHPRLRKAAIRAVEEYGAGAGAVRTIIGTMDIHNQMEAVLAEFKREEAVIVFQSGLTCNSG